MLVNATDADGSMRRRRACRRNLHHAWRQPDHRAGPVPYRRSGGAFGGERHAEQRSLTVTVPAQGVGY